MFRGYTRPTQCPHCYGGYTGARIHPDDYCPRCNGTGIQGSHWLLIPIAIASFLFFGLIIVMFV